MKKFRSIGMVCLLTAVLSFFNSCKKETVDVTELLNTVPSSSAGVMVFNLEGMLEDMGCKVNGHEIKPGKEVLQMIDNSSTADKETLNMIFNGDTGIEPKGAVVFYDSNRAYLTFALCDVKKFCEFIEMKQGSTFRDETDNVKVCGKIAVRGSQAWVCLTSGKNVDADGIVSYSKLLPSQSFLTTPMGEKLLVEENDIRGWAIINTFFNDILTRSERNVATLGLGFIFESADAVSFKMDFDEGEIEAEAMILNDKGKPAKYLLSSDKIDVNTLKSLGETCDAMMSFTVNSKLIKKFDQLGSLMGGALFGDLGDMFKNIDGTVGIVSGGGDMEESINGVITTKGDLNKMFKDFISNNYAPIKEDGKLMRFAKGEVKGNLTIEECSEALKGSCVGLIFDATGLKGMGYDNPIPMNYKWMAIKLKPESGGLEMELEIKTQSPKENALLSIIKGKN